MGLAIILGDADYSQSGLGQVTLKGQGGGDDVPTQNGLTHDYDAYGAGGATLTDKKSTTTITLNGSYLNNYISLNSGSSDSMQVSSRAACGAMVDGLYTWTLEIVAKVSGWNATQDTPLYADYGSEANGKIQIHLGTNGSKTAGVYVRNNRAWLFDEMANANNAVDYTAPHTFHLVRALESTSSTFKLYIDGVLVDTAQIEIYYSTIAKASDILHATGERLLYAVRSYDREISEAEALANHKYNVARYNFT